MPWARLQRLGIVVPGEVFDSPDTRLYEFVEAQVGPGRAHSRFNALRRRLVSFLAARMARAESLRGPDRAAHDPSIRPLCQALSKLERGFGRDMLDVHVMVDRGMVDPARLLELFDSIAEQLFRCPAVDAQALRVSVVELRVRPG